VNNKYRKKPVIIEAIQWTKETMPEVMKFTKELGEKRLINIDDTMLVIRTLEGDIVAKPGDYIIKGIKGEFYPCRADIFKLTYEEVK